MPEVENLAGEQLRSLIDRIETLEEEKTGITADIREIYGEAKSSGFNPKVIRQIIRLRKMDAHDRLEQEELLQLYQQAIGMT
ncbi:MAG: DUF2312 domain-containing protein [Alphaproteobacteria bacterium]|nr:DUF2312 domain-containing protein [Alphaproteobacteria bacterium]